MSRRGRLPSAEDVLSGRASIDVHGLVALINTVNPTGRGLRPREELRAYGTKAALQSLLLRRFAELVHVEESEPGIVALSLRETGERAAHCPIDALEPDVRSRVRFELDTGAASGAEGAAEERSERASTGWSARAKSALDRYDYDEAEAVLREASALAPTDAAPAVALLELLVDQLGNPAAAREVWRSLDAIVRADRRVAGAVAVVAALEGDAAMARELLRTVRGERASEAWAHLARHAMAKGDEALAREAREALFESCPAHPAIAALDAHLEARRERGREEAEARLLAAEAEGLPASELEERAKGLHGAYPRSAVAARVLRSIAENAKRARIEERLARAEEQAPVDDAAAVARWREALSLGADPAPFSARMAAAEERLRIARVEQAAADIAAAFARAELEPAIVRALDAEPGVLDALRARLEPHVLETLARAERIARAASARPKDCARAALAFEGAEHALERGDAAAATLLLERHAKLVASIAETALLRERLRERERDQARASARSALHDAREALASGALDEARRSLSRARAADLDDGAREEHASLVAVIERAEQERAFDATLDAREHEARWLDVVAMCEAELERIGEPAAPGRRHTLSARARRARERARAAYRLAALPLAGGEGRIPPLAREQHVTAPITGVATDGTLIAVTGGGGWIVVRWIDLERDAVLRAVCLRPPGASPMSRPKSLLVHEGRISIATSDANVHSLGEDGELCAAVAFEEARDNRQTLQLVARSHFAWHPDPLRREVRIYDLRTGQLRRVLSAFDSMRRIAGAPLVARPSGGEEEGGFDTFHARGTRAGRVALPGPLLNAAEQGGELYALARKRRAAETWVAVRCDLASGTSTPLLEIDAGGATRGAFVATSDAIFVAKDVASHFVLEAHTRDEHAAPGLSWRAEVAHAALVWDRGRAFALLPAHDEQRYVALSSSPSDAPSAAPFPLLWTHPFVSRPFPLSREAAAIVAAEGRLDRHEAPLEARRVMDEFNRGLCGIARPSAMLARLVESEMFAVGAALMKELVAAAPNTPTMKLWRARGALELAKWTAASELLDDAEGLIDAGSDLWSWCHFARGMIAYATGDVDGAIERWALAAPEDDGEAAETCRALALRVRALHGSAEGPQEDDAHALLLAAIGVSDERASAGDLDGAIAALDHDLVWRASEPQSWARLVARHLEREPRSAGEWLRKLEVLAQYVHAGALALPIVLAVPGAHWPEERLREILERARGWLEEARPPGV